MLNLAAITARLAYICSGRGQNECLPRLAAICAATCLALAACAQPPAPQPAAPLPATPSPTQPAPAIPSIAIATPAAQPTPAPAQPSAPVHPIAPKPTLAPAPTATLAPVVQPTPTPHPTDPPANVAFTQITAGKDHACGLRQNAAIACWGNNSQGQAAPPQGAFTQITAGRDFACALRQDATIACWGNNSHGQASPPKGSFTQITAGAANACAIPLPQTAPPKLICWGYIFPNGAESLTLTTPLSNIQVIGASACGLTPQADMACLSMANRATEITPGPFTQLAAGDGNICALRQDGGVSCQGRNYSRRANPPPTKFAQIATGWNHTCGITRENRIECWSSGVPGVPGELLTAPNGEFTAIAIGWQNSCALRPNGQAACWRAPDYLPPVLPAYGASLAFDGAEFNSPVDILPWQNGALAIVDREGVITAHYDQPNAPPPQTILDISHAVACCKGESGMFSAALDPAFNDFPFLYIWYRTIADNALGESAPGFVGRLARFRVNNGAALKTSELPILEIPMPEIYHFGGAVRFGPDGMLYLGIGDNETPANAQSLNDLRGKIIRIDIRGANLDQPYRVPPDNPFAHNPDARPEIWTYGLRNPWRMAFDPANPGSLFVADVGNKTREEVSIATAAANLGWPLCEADICQESLDPAIAAKFTPPAVAYGKATGCAVIGGVTVPWLDNRFIFGDLCSRRVWLLDGDQASGWHMREIANLFKASRNILAFGSGEDGSVYILSYRDPILRLDPSLAGRLPDSPAPQ